MSAKKHIFHKRKRKHQNVSDDRTASFLAKSREYDPDKTGDKGLWCRECRRRITWRELKIKHEHDRKLDSIFRVWICPRCGDVVREDNLTDLGMVQDMDAQPGVKEMT